MSVVFEKPSDLSDYLFRIVDNGGSSADRYTVLFSDGSYLALSGAPSHPQGVSQSGEDLDPATLEEWVEQGEAVDLALGDLPPGLIEHIIYRCNEGLSDFLEAVEANDPQQVAPSREKAQEHEGTHRDLGVGIHSTPGGYRVRIEGDDAENDRGPYASAREVVLATLPDHYALAGPEYHSSLDVMRLIPSEEVKEAIAALEQKRDAEPAPGPGR